MTQWDKDFIDAEVPGPIPLFRRSVKYEDIISVEIGRTTILDGYGIHKSLRGGWV